MRLNHFFAASLLLFCSALSSAYALNPNLPPGSNFDLSHWYLQLPTSHGILTAASGTVDSASTAQLVAGFTNAYFYTAADGSMTFWAPNNGARTGGSTHPRSELRELLDPNSTDVNWTVYGSNCLTATCVVSNVPSDTGKVCIGQIHEPNNKPDGSASANNELTMIMFDLNNQKVYANVNLDGDLSSSFSTTFISGSSVGLGKPITYSLLVVNGVLKVIINNVTNSWDLFSGTNYQGHIAQSWDRASSNTVYFKAGDYNQATDTTLAGGARVAFSSLTSYHAPSITIQPTNRTGIVGGNTTFSVGALGNGALSYQWWLNGASSLDGATNASLVVTNLSGANVGSYSVVVGDSSSGFNSVTSSVATLTGNFPPVITSQPASQAVSAGNNATFIIGANGSAPLTYRWWFRTNTFLPWATGNSATVTNAQLPDSGAYFVVVSNSFGVVTSAVATLTLDNFVTSTNVYLFDRWLDGTRTNIFFPGDAAWFASSAASLSAVTNALVGTPDPASTLTWWTYFTGNPPPLAHLTVGDTLRVTLKFTASGMINNNARGLRLGLYNSASGLRTLADGASPNGTNFTGYMLNMNFSTIWNFSTGTMQFLERTNLGSGNLIGTVNDYIALAAGGPAAGGAGFSNGVPYTLQLLVKRNSSSVDLAATFTSTNNWSASFTATDTNSLASDFDTFVFRPALQSQSATNFTFTEFKVELVASTNHPPVPATHAFIVGQNQSLLVLVANLLATDFDADGDALSVMAVRSVSANSGVVALANGNITYVPPVNFTGADSFSYTLSDARGGSSIGSVMVSVATPPAVTNLSQASDRSTFTLSGSGLANQPYVLQTTSSLMPPVTWLPVTTNNAAANGAFSLTDPQAGNFTQRFYRVATP
ncbi:MAG TPA: polysaccharide lyase family 7 protein [Verrucomicrobiae bacterium]|nr:polysaccharide lyase family 7 protein [Verrucomicrobiae bacterium]